MNVFFLLAAPGGEGGAELVTPPLDGTILPGVTRQSVLDLARSFSTAHGGASPYPGLAVTERPLLVEELRAAARTVRPPACPPAPAAHAPSLSALTRCPHGGLCSGGGRPPARVLCDRHRRRGAAHPGARWVAHHPFTAPCHRGAEPCALPQALVISSGQEIVPAPQARAGSADGAAACPPSLAERLCDALSDIQARRWAPLPPRFDPHLPDALRGSPTRAGAALPPTTVWEGGAPWMEHPSLALGAAKLCQRLG